MQNSRFFEYLSSLIDDGNQSYEDLNSAEEFRLISYYIFEDEDRRAFLASSDLYSLVIEELCEYMATGEEKFRQNCMGLMITIAKRCFRDEISRAIEPEVTSREHSQNYERGMKKSYDEQTGEVRWHK